MVKLSIHKENKSFPINVVSAAGPRGGRGGRGGLSCCCDSAVRKMAVTPGTILDRVVGGKNNPDTCRRPH